jgi:proteasome activator subunit 4
MKMMKFKKLKRLYNIQEIINEEKFGPICINIAAPGYRVDNSFHLYDPHFLNNIEDPFNESDIIKWNQTFFIDKSYFGYYCWPSTININLNTREVFTFENNEDEKILIKEKSTSRFDTALFEVIKTRFESKSFVNRFIKLSLIEESKGNEKFNKKKFYLFKSLFRNFGTIDIINDIYENLIKLISDRSVQTHECSHKLAAELLSGLIRGSKYWNISQLKIMWSNIKKILDLIIENISTDTLNLWQTCFFTAFVSKTH